MSNSQKNVLGEPLESCGTDPITGYHRDGSCNTDDTDRVKVPDFEWLDKLKQEEAEINQYAMFEDYMRWLRTTDAPPKWTNWEDEESKKMKEDLSSSDGEEDGFESNFSDELSK